MDDPIDSMIRDEENRPLIDEPNEAVINLEGETAVNEQITEGVINLEGDNETGKDDDGKEADGEENVDLEENGENDTAFQRKRRKKSSSVWEDFQVVTDSNDAKWAQCIHCKTKMKMQKSSSTTAYGRHRDICIKRKLYLKNKKMLNFKPTKSKVELPMVTSGKYDHAKQREAVAHWILMNEKPFTFVTWVI